MEKTPAYFCVFWISIHSFPFLFIPVFDFYSFFLLFISFFPFRDPKTIQTEHFWVDFFAQKTFPFKFPIWVPSRDPPKMFKMNNFKWTIVYTIALHASTDQSKGLLFCLLDLTNLTPWKVFCQKIWNTKMAYGKKHLQVSFVFFAFLSVPLHSCFLIFTNFFSSSFLCFPSGIQKVAKLNTFEWIFLHKKHSLSNFQLGFQVVLLQKSSKWTILSGQLGQLFIQLLSIPPLTKVRGSFFLCWISRFWFL